MCKTTFRWISGHFRLSVATRTVLMEWSKDFFIDHKRVWGASYSRFFCIAPPIRYNERKNSSLFFGELEAKCNLNGLVSNEQTNSLSQSEGRICYARAKLSRRGPMRGAEKRAQRLSWNLLTQETTTNSEKIWEKRKNPKKLELV